MYPVDQNFSQNQYYIDQTPPECSICLENLLLISPITNRHKDITFLACNHLFHTECLASWIVKKPEAPCPLCRNKLALKEFSTFLLSDKDIDDFGKALHSANKAIVNYVVQKIAELGKTRISKQEFTPPPSTEKMEKLCNECIKTTANYCNKWIAELEKAEKSNQQSGLLNRPHTYSLEEDMPD